MGVLRNPGHESAVQVYILEGTTKVAAWRLAYPNNRSKPATQSVRADEMFNRPEVIDRCAELQAMKEKLANERFMVDAAYVLRRLTDIDRMDILDILEEDGTVKPVSEWPLIWRNFVQQFEVEELFAGRGDERLNIGLLRKLKWPDKLRNLELLGKHVDVGAFRDNLALTGAGGGPIKTITTDMTPQQAAEAYADTLHN